MREYVFVAKEDNMEAMMTATESILNNIRWQSGKIQKIYVETEGDDSKQLMEVTFKFKK
jgi:hypothetical protein